MDRPAYQSDTYYKVVLGTEQFQGWRNIYAGDGTLIFRNQSGDEAKFYGGPSIGWLKSAWEQFTAMAAGGKEQA
jgi:hypothetical protein